MNHFSIYSCSVSFPADPAFNSIESGLVNVYTVLGELGEFGYESEIADHNPEVLASMQGQVHLANIHRISGQNEFEMTLSGAAVSNHLAVSIHIR